MQEITDTLKAANKEFTSAPYWLIIDMDGKSEISDIRVVASMITGPFFSRPDADNYLDASRHNFSDDAKVYCKSGHESPKYLRLWKWVEARAEHNIAEANRDPLDVEFTYLAEKVNAIAVNKGWGKEDRNDGEAIALMHSELSEALEGLRHGNPSSNHIPEFSAVEEELADVVIRIMDYAVAKKHRVAEAVLAKVAFNETREFRHGGKKF